MAVHWSSRGLTEQEREDRWSEYLLDPDGYETPTACPRAYLPMAGEGHTLEGIWPPRDVPAHVWSTLQLYRYCDQWQTLPRAGGMLSQCAWTMDAFAVIGATQGQIRDARMKWDTRQRETKASRGGAVHHRG